MLRTQRASLREVNSGVDIGQVLDLWSIGEEWRTGVHEAAASGERVVLLSSIGLCGRRDLSDYERDLAAREDEARSLLRRAITLRLAPVFDDLSVYDEPLRAHQPVHHAYGDEPIAWLRAQDALEVVRASASAPDRSVFHLAGATAGTADEALVQRAARMGVRAPQIVPVEANVLVDRLSAVFGRSAASVFVGHQRWAGRTASNSELGARTLTQALKREPTGWHAPHTTSK